MGSGCRALELPPGQRPLPNGRGRARPSARPPSLPPRPSARPPSAALCSPLSPHRPAAATAAPAQALAEVASRPGGSGRCCRKRARAAVSCFYVGAAGTGRAGVWRQRRLGGGGAGRHGGVREPAQENARQGNGAAGGTESPLPCLPLRAGPAGWLRAAPALRLPWRVERAALRGGSGGEGLGGGERGPARGLLRGARGCPAPAPGQGRSRGPASSSAVPLAPGSGRLPFPASFLTGGRSPAGGFVAGRQRAGSSGGGRVGGRAKRWWKGGVRPPVNWLRL